MSDPAKPYLDPDARFRVASSCAINRYPGAIVGRTDLRPTMVGDTDAIEAATDDVIERLTQFGALVQIGAEGEPR